MFIRITNTPRPYAWGSPTAIASLLGTEPSGGPEAELWLGTHPGSPSVVVDPDTAGGARTLAEALGGGLPFLLKILAADAPLSLQAHPTAEQARAGFERENAAGIPLDAPHRNYRDPFPKPEVIYALSERFDALCGFRDPAEAMAVVVGIGGADPVVGDFVRRLGSASLAEVFEWLIRRGPGVDELVERMTAAAASAADGIDTDASALAAADTVRMLASHYPGDPGIVIALLLNRVTLTRGQALYLPAGNIHAYLSGLGVELMTASDNVLRGGLTPKHVDVDELLSVLDFTPRPVPWLNGVVESPGVEVFRPAGAGFRLAHVTGGGECPIDGPSIALCTAGATEAIGRRSSIGLRRGDAVLITAEEGSVRFPGDAEVFVAAERAD